MTGKIVALKNVRFDNLEPENVKFMAREILILQRLDHPNVVKFEGLVTSRMTCSLYLVFEYMVHDLFRLAASPRIKFIEPQVCLDLIALLFNFKYIRWLVYSLPVLEVFLFPPSPLIHQSFFFSKGFIINNLV